MQEHEAPKESKAGEKGVERPLFMPSPGFAEWLESSGGSLVLSTYQSGRVVFLGIDANGRFYGQERVIGTAMGLAYHDNRLWVGCRDQIWTFSRLSPRVFEGRAFDAVFKPHLGYLVGQCNTHDVVADVSFRGEHHDLLIANTQYSCVSALDPVYSFRPVWKPGFVSALVPEDRCHLNGVCAEDGELAYATICGQFDERLAWKKAPTGQGFVTDVRTDEVVCSGLSMPHSPRMHDGRLWLLNSGEGEFGFVDRASGNFQALAPCAGFARGLAFVEGHAVVGLSRLRVTKEGLLPATNLAQRLADRRVIQRCGLQVFDLSSGRLSHWLNIEGVVSELYDVLFLPGVRRPGSPGFSALLNPLLVDFPQPAP